MSDGKMTKMERVELCQLIRKRERVMRAATAERAAEMLAEFDHQIAKIYKFDDDKVWAEATQAAQNVVNEANKKIADRCHELGIPEEFAPQLAFGWMGRGQNAVAGRRAELRRLAKSRIDAIEMAAKTKIERLSLEAQTEVVANGLESESAKLFLEKMPALQDLMPQISAAEIKKASDERHRRKQIDYL